MTARRLLSFSAILAMCFAGYYSPSLLAQGSDLGTIRGTVTDSSGALVPNAQILVTNTGNLRVYTFKTDARGNFDAPDLTAGQYKVTISAPGFETDIIDGVVLNGSDVAEDNMVLRPAKQTVNVEVTSEAVGINTDNSTLSQTLDSKAVLDLPRDSRNINEFLYIDPSITQGSAGPGSFKAVGTQSYGASFSLDGQRNSGGITGSETESQPSLESVGEVNVLSNSFSAEYAGVVNIRINTKSGGSQNHGSLFYNNVNSALAAAPLGVKKTRSNDTQYGGSWGGPIPKLKNTFFFTAFEYWDSANPIFELNQTGVLSPLAQGGNFSELNLCDDPALSAINADSPGGAAPAGLQTGTCTPASGAPYTVVTGVPAGAQNPITSKLVSLYFPRNIPDSGVNPLTGLIKDYSTTLPGSDKVYMGDLRIDHDFNDRNRVYGVYHGSAEDNAESAVSYPYTGLGLLNTFRNNSALSLSYTHVFTPNLLNEARGGYNTQDEFLRANTTVNSFLTSIGFSPADLAAYDALVGSTAAAMYGNTNISFGGGISTFGDGGRSSDRNLTQHLTTFGDTVSWQKGRHSLRLGADFVRNEAVDGFGQTRNTPQGTMSYNGSTLTGYTNFLLGNAPHSYGYVELPRPATDVSNWETAYYVQDDFRVNPRLTVNLGFRYDRYTPYVDKNDIMANFDPNFRDPSTGEVGRYIIPSTKTLQYLQSTESDNPPQGIGYAIASETGLGIGRGLVRPDRFDFGPRAGWAYRLTDKRVLRGGFGLYYPTSSAHVIRDPLTTNAFNALITGTATSTQPISGWPVGNETVGVTPLSGGSRTGFGSYPTANYVPVGIKNPRLMEWNATFEQQLSWQTTLRVSYIGASQQGQIIGNDLDMIQASNNPFGTTQGLPSNGLQLPETGYTGPYNACDPYHNHDCNYSEGDNARITFPELGDFVIGFGNHGKSRTNSAQVQVERKAKGLTYSLSYTYMDQKSSAADVGDDSLGADNYDPFNPNLDYTRDSFVSPHRVVAYAVYDLPFGQGQHFGATVNKVADEVIGGWELSTNMFAKSGVGFTPSWTCGDCDPVMPGNIASGAEEPVGDFTGAGFRPNIMGNPYKGRQKGFQFAPVPVDTDGHFLDTGVFQTPDIGSTYWTDPLVAKRNALTGPSTWGANLGVHKSFRVNDRISVKFGADVDNVFNHPMLSPASPDSYANLGTVYVMTPASLNGTDGALLPTGEGRPAGAPGYLQQPALVPLNNQTVTQAVQLNSAFGKNNASYSQEGINGNRDIRLIGRITF
jgi:Carboxypeptidase regulatory-like domain